MQTADGVMCMTLLCRHLTEWCVCVCDVTVQTPDGVVYMTLLFRHQTEWCV